MTVFVSPTEPESLRSLGIISSDCEKAGVDFLWAIPEGRLGIQRKELKDLLASLRDGRLTKEVGQMEGLAIAVLIIEGPRRWRADGSLSLGRFSYKFSRKQMAGLTFSLLSRDIWVLHTLSTDETIKTILWLHEWSTKTGHIGLRSRPKPGGEWGSASHEEFQIHLLQGFPGIGPGTAARILEKFGKVPLTWDCTPEELLEVEGVGKKRVEQLLNALQSPVP